MPEPAPRSGTQPVLCPRPGHASLRVVKKGRRSTSAGNTQRYECAGENGAKHTFAVPLPDSPAGGARSLRVPCPDPRHADSRVQSRGTRTNKAGTWRRYRCVRPDGTSHAFRVVSVTEKACADCSTAECAALGTVAGLGLLTLLLLSGPLPQRWS